MVKYNIILNNFGWTLSSIIALHSNMKMIIKVLFTMIVKYYH